MEEEILVNQQGQIAVITINRPEVHNALNRSCWLKIRDAFLELDERESVRAIILTGAGEKAFAAGADIRSLLDRSALRTLDCENGGVTRVIEQVSKLTIAAVNGLALGGGCELALACDLRIASSRAKLGQTELNVGILPGAGGTQRLTRLVGQGKALELILTGEAVSAEEALRIGLVNKVAAPEKLMDEAVAMCERIITKSPVMVRLAKLAIKEGAKTDLSAALLVETLCQSVAFGTADHTEGLTAFLEKRPPHYNGE